MLNRISIRNQLLVLVMAAVLPATGLVAYALMERLHDARNSAEQQLQALATDTAGRIDVVLNRRAELLARLADRPLVRALDAQRCDAMFSDFVTMQTEFVSLALRNSQGETLCASQPITLSAAGARALPWFQDGLARQGFAVGGAFARPPDGRWVSMLMQPVRHAAGDVGGLLILAVDVQTLQRQLLPALPQGTQLMVLDREQKFLMRSPDPLRWIGQPVPAEERAQLPPRAGVAVELQGHDGVTRLSVAAEAVSSGWRVHAAMPVDSIYASYQALLRRCLMVGAAALALVGLMLWRLNVHITQPINALAASAAAAAGSPASPVPGSSPVAAAAADLQRLADQSEQMKSQHALLSASYQQLANASRDIVLVVDPLDDRIVQANEAAAAAYGYRPDELLALSMTDLRAAQARGHVAIDRKAATQPQGAFYETVHQRKDSSPMPVEVSVRPFEVGGRTYVQSFIRDVSERNRNEALLAGQRAVLAQIAQGAPMTEALDALARLVQAQAPGMLASILLLDDDGVHVRHGAAPSLPQDFVNAVDGAAIGPRAGSCGTAAHRRAPVVTEDIATDPLWADWRAPALAQGLRACWSTPIVDAQGGVLGTFAMYFRRPGRPKTEHQRLVDLVTHTAAIAILSARAARLQRAQVDELLRWQDLMIDREERMQAIKAEVDTLRARQGEPPHYGGTDPV